MRVARFSKRQPFLANKHARTMSVNVLTACAILNNDIGVAGQDQVERGGWLSLFDDIKARRIPCHSDVICGVTEHRGLIGEEQQSVDEIGAAAELGIKPGQPLYYEMQQQPVVAGEIAMVEARRCVRQQ